MICYKVVRPSDVNEGHLVSVMLPDPSYEGSLGKLYHDGESPQTVDFALGFLDMSDAVDWMIAVNNLEAYQVHVWVAEAEEVFAVDGVDDYINFNQNFKGKIEDLIQNGRYDCGDFQPPKGTCLFKNLTLKHPLSGCEHGC